MNKCVKENGGIITFTFTFSDQEKVKHDKHVHNGGKTSKNGGNTTTKQHGFPETQKHKKKSPSRRRCDRARLHKFLEKKKHQRQLSSAKPESLTLPQCTPPRDQSISVSHSQPLVLATSPPQELPQFWTVPLPNYGKHRKPGKHRKHRKLRKTMENTENYGSVF